MKENEAGSKYYFWKKAGKKRKYELSALSENLKKKKYQLDFQI